MSLICSRNISWTPTGGLVKQEKDNERPSRRRFMLKAMTSPWEAARRGQGCGLEMKNAPVSSARSGPRSLRREVAFLSVHSRALCDSTVICPSSFPSWGSLPLLHRHPHTSHCAPHFFAHHAIYFVFITDRRVTKTPKCSSLKYGHLLSQGVTHGPVLEYLVPRHLALDAVTSRPAMAH